MKINKVFLLFSGSIFSIGSNGGKDKVKKVDWLMMFGVFLLKFCKSFC